MFRLFFIGVWIFAATLGGAYVAISASAPASAEAVVGDLDPATLEFVETELLATPQIRNGQISGYVLSRLIYTLKPDARAVAPVPVETLFADGYYDFAAGNPLLNLKITGKIDIDAISASIRDRINARAGKELIHDVLIVQIDFLKQGGVRTKSAARRAVIGGEDKPEPEKKEKPSGH